MRDAEEVARESLGNIAGPLRSIFRGPKHRRWLDVLDILIEQETEHLTELIRARDAEVAAKERREQTRSYIERKTSDYAHNYDSGGKVDEPT